VGGVSAATAQVSQKGVDQLDDLEATQRWSLLPLVLRADNPGNNGH